MMTQPNTDQDLFQEHLETLYQQIASGDALQKIRAKAWDHFLELGLPSRKAEVFRYIRLRQLFERRYTLSRVTDVSPEAIEPYIFPECREAVAVFVNGHFRPQLSRLGALPKRVVFTSLIDATKTYGAFINNQWAKSLKDETDPFAALNAALHRDGAFLYLPPKTVVETPIQLLHVIDAQSEPMLLMPRLHVFAGTQSQIALVSNQAVLSGNGYCVNRAVDMSLEDDAHVHYTHVDFEEPDDAWHFEALRAYLKRNSTLKTVQATDGGLTVRHDYRVALTGENAEALLNSVWMLSGKKEAHHHVLMDHQAPHCRSMQLFKGVLNDVSHSSFEGKILVRQPAQKTEAFQLNNNLLLSDRATANSKPNLEIFADDVKASHGATIGQLDAEQLIYMKTRGFSSAEAKNLLVHAFCKEVIDLITLPSLLEDVTQRSARYLTKG